MNHYTLVQFLRTGKKPSKPAGRYDASDVGVVPSALAAPKNTSVFFAYKYTYLY